MSHSKVNIYIHCIWSTNQRAKIITHEVEPLIHQAVYDEFIYCGCEVDSLNGTEDHLHVQFKMHPKLNIREILKQVKGASSHNINREGYFDQPFSWSIGYAAFSVSYCQIPRVRLYIQNQKIHHKTLSLKEELMFLTDGQPTANQINIAHR